MAHDQKRMKDHFFFITGLVILAAAALLLVQYANREPVTVPSWALAPDKIEVVTGEDEVCIQVVVQARNLATGEIKEFPNPCDIPEGWEIIPELVQ